MVEVKVAGPGGQAYLTVVFEVPLDWIEDGRWESYFANWEGRLGQYLTALSVLKQYDQLVEGGRASSRRRRAIWRYIKEYVEREPGAGWRRIWRSLPEERASASEVELEDGSMYQVYREGKGDREGDRAVQVPLDGGPPSDLARETFRKYVGRISRSRR